MPSITTPIGDGPLAVALRKLARHAPDEPTLYELVRRRLLALIAGSGLTVTETARRSGVRHQSLVRKLLPADAPDSRALDTETVEAVLAGLDAVPNRLVRLEHELADVEVLRHLRAACDAAEEGQTSRFLRHGARDAVSLSRLDAAAIWPDAEVRIARLLALGFLVTQGTGAVALSPTGRACAAR